MNGSVDVVFQDFFAVPCGFPNLRYIILPLIQEISLRQRESALISNTATWSATWWFKCAHSDLKPIRPLFFGYMPYFPCDVVGCMPPFGSQTHPHFGWFDPRV